MEMSWLLLFCIATALANPFWEEEFDDEYAELYEEEQLEPLTRASFVPVPRSGVEVLSLPTPQFHCKRCKAPIASPSQVAFLTFSPL
jgi:hypothetical protein